MKIKESFQGEIVILELSGNLMGGDKTGMLHRKIKELIEEGFKKFVIDLASVKWMNSSGLGALISCLTTIKSAEGNLKIANSTEKVKSILMITHLTKTFQNYDSVEKAVASFSL